MIVSNLYRYEMSLMSGRNGQISMDMVFTNKTMQPMGGFAIQLNKNSFGLTPAAPLHVPAPLAPGAMVETSVTLSTVGAVQRMEPLNNLQVAIKNNIDVFYFACIVPMNVYFTEDGQLDKRVFLSTWKDIPAQNEVSLRFFFLFFFKFINGVKTFYRNRSLKNDTFLLLAGAIYVEWNNVDGGSSCAKDATEQCFHNCQKKCGRTRYALSIP